MNHPKKLWYENKLMVGGGNNKFAGKYDAIFPDSNKLNIMSDEERKAVEKLKKANEIEGRKGCSKVNLNIYTTIPVQDHF